MSLNKEMANLNINQKYEQLIIELIEQKKNDRLTEEHSKLKEEHSKLKEEHSKLKKEYFNFYKRTMKYLLQ